MLPVPRWESSAMGKVYLALQFLVTLLFQNKWCSDANAQFINRTKQLNWVGGYPFRAQIFLYYLQGHNWIHHLNHNYFHLITHEQLDAILYTLIIYFITTHKRALIDANIAYMHSNEIFSHFPLQYFYISDTVA